MRLLWDSLSDGWAHILDEDGSASQYCSADYLTRIRDYTGENEADEPDENDDLMNPLSRAYIK